MGETIVTLEGIRKRYGTRAARIDALDGVDLRLDTGSVVAVVGPSGSGKSTLLHIIGGMDRADDGQAWVAGDALHSLNPAGLTRFRRQKVGFVFQAFNLIPNLNALENIALPAEFAGTPTRQAHRRAAELLERVGLTGRRNHRPGELSGGEQQRIAIARALINHPALVIADEPTGNLDSRTGAAIIALLTELAGPQTVIIASHDHRIATAADRVIEIADGRITQNVRSDRPADASWNGNAAAVSGLPARPAT